MLKANIQAKGFPTPRIIFTLAGNPRSEAVIRMMQSDESFKTGQEFVIFENPDQIKEKLSNGVSPSEAVVLYDGGSGTRMFKMECQGKRDCHMPSWSCQSQWGVRIGERAAGCSDPAKKQSVADNRSRNIANQVRSDFSKSFQERLTMGVPMRSGGQIRMSGPAYPWGRPRNGENPPSSLEIPSIITDVVTALNFKGWNMAASVAGKDFARDLPKDSRISWYRVPAEPVSYEGPLLTDVVDAFAQFERACATLVGRHADIQAKLLAGVDIPLNDPKLQQVYLFPKATEWSARRPDLHVHGRKLAASENDEMPGGLAEQVLIDMAYDINQDRWKKCFDWLTERGTLVFMVSSKWSEVYIESLGWLVTEMRRRGYDDVHLVTSENPVGLTVETDKVLFNGQPVGTIWRQFPIFETAGILAQLVLAAHRGAVRMVPEFAHFGNKTWFSIFSTRKELFREFLDERAMELLEEVLPKSHLVINLDDFPANMGDMVINDLAHLKSLAEKNRDGLVLKVAGANPKAARSYGVLMGSGLPQVQWIDWIHDRLAAREPFVIQKRFETSIERVAVMNTSLGRPEIFDCRVLIRPWWIGDQLVSASGCAVPSSTLRVHGRVDMAMIPILFQDTPVKTPGHPPLVSARA